jgi:hypothetical protein
MIAKECRATAAEPRVVRGEEASAKQGRVQMG